MRQKIEQGFYLICKEILDENLTIEKWTEIESDDMFSRGKYSGGFDATEMEFCFSIFDINNKEYCLQLSLNNIKDVVAGKIKELDINEAPY